MGEYRGSHKSIVLALLLLSACSREVEVPTGLEALRSLEVSGRSGANACRLLMADELELVFNSPIVNSVPGGRQVVPGMSMCSAAAESEDTDTGKRQGPQLPALAGEPPETRASWGSVAEGGRTRFQAFARVNRRFLIKTEVDGYPAYWDPRLQTLLVLKTDKLVGVRLFVKEPPVTGQDKQSTYLQTASGLLASRAMKRL